MKPNIEGFPNYHITKEGDVFNLKTGRKMKPVLRDDGYIVFCLSNNSKQKVLKQHRMLAIAYLPNPDGKPHINHIDSDRSNNELSNLEWVTHRENMLHARENGRMKFRQPVPHKIGDYDKSLLTNKQIRFVEALNELEYPREVMRHLGIDKSAFYKMLKRVQARLGLDK